MSRKGTWSSTEDKILLKYYGKKPTKEICKLLNRKVESIRHRVVRLGIQLKKNAPKWDKNEDKILIENYGLIPIRDIAKKFTNRSQNSIIQRICQLKLPDDFGKRHNAMILATRKHDRNDNAFSEINELSAYWAGFIAADGHIEIRNAKENQLAITLARADRHHLEKLKEYLGYSGPILDYISEGNKISKLCISSQIMCDDLLLNFNIHGGNKTFNLGQPYKLISENYQLAFLKGAIDGDGGIYCYDKTPLRFFIGNGSKVFVDWCKKIMIEYSSKDKDITISDITLGNTKPTNKCKNPEPFYRFTLNSRYAVRLYQKIIILKCPGLDRKWHQPSVLEYINKVKTYE